MGLAHSTDAPDSPSEFDLSLDVELGPGAIAPAYGKTGSGAFTIYAPRDIEVTTEGWQIVSTGLTFSLPFMLVISVDGYSADVVVHRTILDCENTEELWLPLIYRPGDPHKHNSSKTVRRGEPLARGLVLPIARPGFRLYAAETERV